MKRDIVKAGLSLAVMFGVTGGLVATHPAAAAVKPHPVTVTAGLPACMTEDQTRPNCFWDAHTRGNGLGQSFVVWDGQAVMLPL